LTVRPGTDILGAVPAAEPRSGLRAARTARGWSQSEAARALARLARDRGVPVAAPASLKTQLSRWENGHAAPEPPYRALLEELYAITGADLGLERRPAADAAGPRDRLRARVAAAAAVDGAVLALWGEQLAAAQGLDDRLGAGAVQAVEALVAQLEAVLPHLPDVPRRRAAAAVLARAAILAGTQALDAGDPDAAVAYFARAAEVARGAGLPALAVEAAVGTAAALIEVGEASAALSTLDAASAGDAPGPTARLAAGEAWARAAAGDAAGARRALGDAAAALNRQVPDRAHPPSGLALEMDLSTPHDLHRWCGETLAELGDRTAVHHLRAALAGEPASARHRAELHAALAGALSAAGRRAEAAEHAATARALAVRIGSRRIIRWLDGQALRSSPDAASVASSASAAR
jgi:transcriptional regulator with XRE-family HTH domain